MNGLAVLFPMTDYFVSFRVFVLSRLKRNQALLVECAASTRIACGIATRQNVLMDVMSQGAEECFSCRRGLLLRRVSIGTGLACLGNL